MRSQLTPSPGLSIWPTAHMFAAQTNHAQKQAAMKKLNVGSWSLAEIVIALCNILDICVTQSQAAVVAGRVSGGQGQRAECFLVLQEQNCLAGQPLQKTRSREGSESPCRCRPTTNAAQRCRKCTHCDSLRWPPLLLGYWAIMRE